jgi:hypothetical protein
VVIVILELPTATNGDETRIANLREDHGSTTFMVYSTTVISGSYLQRQPPGRVQPSMGSVGSFNGR